MDQLTPKNAEELFGFYAHHLPGMTPDLAFRVTKLGMTMMIDEYKRLIAVEKEFEELKAKPKLGRPPKASQE